MARVFLVGAGPGDPELLTVKAVRLLQRADVVLHDALVTRPILDLVRQGATIIDIGKRRGHKLLTQEEVNSLLVFFAANGATVVRLKGGDPGIFGRTGEEIEALVEAGVEFEIVPGVTSALASAAAAGVSLTDRRFASSVVLTTAHRAAGSAGLGWDKLVTSNSTLAIYMPGQNYAQLSAQLRAAGLPADTPCAVVSSAACPEQRVLYTNLALLERHSALTAPALLIVGRCASALTQLQTLGAVNSLADEHGETNQSENPT
jgi:uroporphyrin-III C-methyltransferase